MIIYHQWEVLNQNIILKISIFFELKIKVMISYHELVFIQSNHDFLT